MQAPKGALATGLPYGPAPEVSGANAVYDTRNTNHLVQDYGKTGARSLHHVAFLGEPVRDLRHGHFCDEVFWAVCYGAGN